MRKRRKNMNESKNKMNVIIKKILHECIYGIYLRKC